MRHAAFTLVELLVVVAIIALLVSLLIPSMESAYAHAVRARCMTHQRHMIHANLSYSLDWQGWYVPVKTKSDANGVTEPWYINAEYIVRTGLSAGRSGDWRGNWWPGGFLSCPVAPAYRPDSNGRPRAWDTLAYNWGGVSRDYPDELAVRRMVVQSPSDKAQMMDANDWQTYACSRRWSWQNRASYSFWDTYGDVDKYSAGAFALVMYRHQEGVVIGFFDGHAGYYTKEQAWKPDSTPALTAAANAHIWEVYD